MHCIKSRLACAAAAMVILTVATAVAASPPIDYDRDIRPILSNNCYKCHGPDEKERQAGLRFDVREVALKPAESGKTAIVAGKPDESELIARIFSTDDDERMPPPDSHKSLTDSQRQLLKQWIAGGAKYDRHWSYVPPQRPESPHPDAGAWPRNPIDNFILARLIQEKLRPSAEADRTTLIRRLSFDLTGLPPNAQEVEEFVGDSSRDPYDRLIDKLLASPHFGERMALNWLDLVRYADSGGYHSDNERSVWPFRDYVIAAFNANKPFDRFTIEQIAGDLLPEANRETRIASGYNRLLQTTEEGGAQAKEYTAKYAADRVRNLSTVWLGSTMGCCECHDHKFDPFKTRDFYCLEAFFADVKENAIARQDETPMPDAAGAAAQKRLDDQIAGSRKTLDTQTPELDRAQVEWEMKAKGESTDWIVVRPISATTQSGSLLKILEDGSVLAVGTTAADKDTYTIAADTDRRQITGIRLEVLDDSRLPAKGPGRASNGNFVLSEFTIALVDKSDPAKSAKVVLRNATADFSQTGFEVAKAIDGNLRTGWAVTPQEGKPHQAIFETELPADTADKSRLIVKLVFEHGKNYLLGKFRLAIITRKPPFGIANSLPPEVAKALQINGEKRTAAQNSALAAYFRSIAPELQPHRKRLADLERQRTDLIATFPKTLIAIPVQPRDVRILPRGNWLDDSGEVVSPAVPGFLPPLEVQGRRPNRLDLARWLVDRKNPLVARVFVNRLWGMFFGQGLVKTAEDFGSQGAPPSHPELLDWLAVEFIDSGWDVKHLVKLMVSSATYRQSSIASPELRQADPDNRWLARQGRFRLDAEFVRDNALAISGLLSPKIGGPSVKPYQPAGYWAYLNFPIREWTNDKGENQNRRGLYTFWQRTFLHPSLKALDAPTREECTALRTRSNTPLQSLVLLNDPTYVEAARVFAARIVKEGGGTPEERIDWAFRQALSRSAKPAEANVLADLYRKHREEYVANKAAAKQLLAIGDAKAPSGFADADLAAWTSVARVIFNLHETITRN
jgi:hypothetical protein